MPNIYLKDKSAEYADEKQNKTETMQCDMPGCRDDAFHKAPKDRFLEGYYWFCLEHVQDYNKAWNFFSGMSNDEVQRHIFNSLYGDRPTQKYSNFKEFEEGLRQKVEDTYHFNERQNGQNKQKDPRRDFFIDRNSPEYEAMLIMGVEPPLDLNEIKARYKELAKKYHPDLNRDDKHAEELLKSINMAYTILKLAHAKFLELEGDI